MALKRLTMMAKRPKAGLVKTRLAADLGKFEAAQIYRDMLTKLILAFGDSHSKIDYSLEIAVSPDDAVDHWHDELSDPCDGWTLIPQGTGDLGYRMWRIFERQLMSGLKDAQIIIGSDLPDLDLEVIGRAFEALENNDLVLGPAVDGGYWLIGLRTPLADRAVELFESMPWSSAELWDATIAKANELQMSVATLEYREDVDDIDSFRRWNECQSTLRDPNPSLEVVDGESS